MSTYLNTLAAPGAAGSQSSAPLGQTITNVLIGWIKGRTKAWNEAAALRRSLHEISQLSDRELLDIGLAHDEIIRLRSSDTFLPQSWQAPALKRDELPF